MNVQHFVGSSMREVLSQVRDALGDDAMILETKETSKGIEVSAVTESPMSVPTPRAEPEPAPAPRPAEPSVERIDVTEHNRQLDEMLSSMADRMASHDEVGAVREEVREEMKSIRSLVESHLAQSGWTATSLGSPLKASVMRNLSALGIAPDIVNRLMSDIDPEQLDGKTWVVPMKLIMSNLSVLKPGKFEAKRIALVGPSGAGKTTTIAKLAARHAIEHAGDEFSIVSLDNHRLGASEQIDALARLLGVPVRRPVGDRSIADLDNELESSQMTLIDTVGLGQHDPRIPEQLARLGDDVSVFLVLPANLEHDAMQEVVDAYASYKPTGVVLTKVDEAATLGAAISVLLRSQLPLAWIADGQRIPDDLHEAANSKAWLVKHAVELMRKRRVTVSERYMAENFFGVKHEELTTHG